MGATATQSPAELQRARAEREKREAEAKAQPRPGEAPDEQPPAPEETEGDGVDIQLSITGDADRKLSPGGKRKPDSATVTIEGGEVELSEGQFELGQRLCLVVEGFVDGEETRYKRDPKTGNVVSVKRKHKLKADRWDKVDLGTGAEQPPAAA